MKKKSCLLIIILLFVFFKMEAQNQYYFQFKLSIEYTPSCSNETQDGETIDVTILNENNGFMADYGIDLNNLPLSYNNGNEVYTYVSEITTLNKRPYKVVANYRAFCEGTGATANAFNSDLLFDNGDFHDYDVRNSNTGLGITTRMEASTSPVLLTPHVDNICLDEIIFTDTETPRSINGLTWYFFNINNEWEELYNYSDFYPLKYSIEDIIGSDYFSITGTNAVKLMYKYQARLSINEIESNIIIVNVGVCSPQIEGEPAIQSATCNYAPLNTGSFTVTFDRPLNDGEQLNNLSLHWAGLDNILDTDDDVSGFDGITGFVSYTGTTFTWPNPIPAGTYRFLYQSGGANSAESYEPIIINAPPPIVFTATKNDILCFNDGNGKIIITVDQAGTGNIGTPPYSYSLNGATLVPFTNGNTHTITGLSAGDYSLKVFDDNNCTEQL